MSNEKTVTLKINVEAPSTLIPGTSAWVLKQIANGYIKVGVTAKKEPGVWLYHGPEHRQCQLLAIRCKDYDNKAKIDSYPLETSYLDNTDKEALGVTLTDAGQKTLEQLSKKAVTLLKLYLRKGDRIGNSKVNVSIKFSN